jgi:MFS family permease
VRPSGGLGAVALSPSGGVVAAVFLASVGFGTLELSLPLNLRAAAASPPTIGLVLSMVGIGFLVFELAWGFIVDRFGAPITMAIAMAGLTLAMAGFLFVDSVVALALLTFLAAGMLDASGPAGRGYLAGALEQSRLGAGLGALTGAWSLGLAVGAPIAGFAIDHFGLRSGFYAAPLFALAAFVTVLLAFRRRSSGTAEAKSSMAGVLRSARGIPMRALLPPSVVVMLLLVGTGAEAAFLPLLITGPLHADAAQAGLAVAVVGALGGLLMIPGGRAGDAYGRRSAVVIGILLSAAGLGAYAVSGAYVLVLGSALVRAGGSALAWPALTAVLAEEAPPASRGVVMAIYGEFESVGLAVGPLLAGLAADRLGLAAAFGISAAVALVALAAMPFSRPRRNSAAVADEAAPAVQTKT